VTVGNYCSVGFLQAGCPFVAQPAASESMKTEND